MDEKKEALTWEELASYYDKSHSVGRKARTLPMDQVFEWATQQKDRFRIDPIEGTIHPI